MNRKSWVRWLDSFSDNLKSKIENLKLAGLSVIVFAFVMVGAVVDAQQPNRIPRIGFLSTAAPPGTPTNHSDKDFANLVMWRDKISALNIDMEKADPG